MEVNVGWLVRRESIGLFWKKSRPRKLWDFRAFTYESNFGTICNIVLRQLPDLRFAIYPSHPISPRDVSHIDSRIDIRVYTSNVLFYFAKRNLFLETSSNAIACVIPSIWPYVRYNWFINEKSRGTIFFILCNATAQCITVQPITVYTELLPVTSFVFDWTRWNNAAQSCRDECKVSVIKLQVVREIFLLDIDYT